MRRHRNAVALVLIFGATPAAAQFSGGLDFGAVGRLNSASQSRFVGGWINEGPLGRVRFDAIAFNTNGSWSFARSGGDASVHSPALGRFRASVAAEYRPTDVFALDGNKGSVLAALSAKIGSASGVAAGFSRSLDARGRPSGLQPSLTGWHVWRSVVFSVTSQRRELRLAGRHSTLSIRTFTDSIYTDTAGWTRYSFADTTGLPGVAATVRHWSDLMARVDWASGRLALSASVAARPRQDSLRGGVFGASSIAVQVTSRIALIAAGGTSPVGAGRAPSARFGSVGLRFAPQRLLRRAPLPVIRTGATAFSVAPLDSGRYRIVLRVPAARSVALSADFTKWSAVSLREVAPGTWELVLPLEAGVYRVNIRVDGDRWEAPPGLPAVEDEFNGRVGLLVVR